MTGGGGKGAREGGLWGGRFTGGMAPEMEPLNRSLGSDWRLWREDLEGSRAWARGLAAAGVLTAGERDRILEGLTGIEARFEEAFPHDAPDEDIHSLVERLLTEAVGPVAGKLHTGRSRNDQVATDFRLWGMRRAESLAAGVSEVARALVDMAEASVEIILPGYTHLQQGQPVRAGHWALSHAWPLLRDRDRFLAAARSAALLPLGSGALAGCPFPVDREALARELGFRGITQNSMDAVSDRDWAAELLFASALLGVHLSRLSEDLLLFSSKEFAFLRIGDGYSTGSSLMPQKRNPDVAELVRGKSGRLLGGLAGFLVLLKGLPTGYNRDLQEDKGLVFEVTDTVGLVLPAMAGAIRSVTFRPDRIEKARDPELLATDLADLLVRAGVPFREAHDHVGSLVREAEDRDLPLSELPDPVFGAVHPALGEGRARAAFDWEASVEARDAAGGTSRRRVLEQVEALRRHLDVVPATRAGEG